MVIRRLITGIILPFALLLATTPAYAATPSHRAIVAVCAARSSPPAGWHIEPFRWRAYCFLHGR